jgi:hypothetical protein
MPTGGVQCECRKKNRKRTVASTAQRRGRKKVEEQEPMLGQCRQFSGGHSATRKANHLPGSQLFVSSESCCRIACPPSSQRSGLSYQSSLLLMSVLEGSTEALMPAFREALQWSSVERPPRDRPPPFRLDASELANYQSR